MSEAEAAKFQLTSAAYLRMKGGGSEVYLAEGTFVGPGTGYDFAGPLTPNMTPLNDAARAAREAHDRDHPEGSTTLKGAAEPSAGGAAPFDPADPKKDSTSEKEAAARAEADKKRQADLDAREKALAQREAALKKAEDEAKAKADAEAKSPTGAAKPSGQK